MSHSNESVLNTKRTSKIYGTNKLKANAGIAEKLR